MHKDRLFPLYGVTCFFVLPAEETEPKKTRHINRTTCNWAPEKMCVAEAVVLSSMKLLAG